VYIKENIYFSQSDASLFFIDMLDKFECYVYV